MAVLANSTSNRALRVVKLHTAAGKIAPRARNPASHASSSSKYFTVDRFDVLQPVQALPRSTMFIGLSECLVCHLRLGRSEDQRRQDRTRPRRSGHHTRLLHYHLRRSDDCLVLRPLLRTDGLKRSAFALSILNKCHPERNCSPAGCPMFATVCIVAKVGIERSSTAPAHL